MAGTPEVAVLGSALLLEVVGLAKLASRRSPGSEGAKRVARARADGAVDRFLCVLSGLAFGACVVISLTGSGRFLIVSAVVIAALSAAWLAKEDLLAGGSQSSGWTGWAAAATFAAAAAAAPVVAGAGDNDGGERLADSYGPVYRVAFTCMDGACGLFQRTGPGSNFKADGEKLPDGTPVSVRCIALGEPAVGHTSRRWAQLANGLFAYARNIDMPRSGPPSIPRCELDPPQEPAS